MKIGIVGTGTVGRGGVIAVLQPQLSDEERDGLQKSAMILKTALERVQAVA